MDRETPPDASKPPKPSRATARDARLKAALKANMGRRKAQARERTAEGGSAAPDGDDDNNDTKNQ